MFVAFQFSRRRFRHQMAYPFVLMWKQMLPPPRPPPRSSVWEYGKQYTYRTVNSSILKWWSLYYFSTNCTLTWGFSHCRLLIYSGMKSVRFQLREKREGHASSSRKWKQSAVLYSAERLKCLHVISFRQICALTPNILFPSPPTQRSSRLRSLVFKMDTRK